VGEQDDRVVVVWIQAEPHEGTIVGLGPQREEGGLPVSRRGDNGDGGHLASGSKPGEESRPGDHAGPNGGLVELRLEDLDGEVTGSACRGRSGHR